PGKSASDEMHAPLRAGRARRVVDAYGPARCRRDADLADVGSLGMQHRQQRAAQPKLLAVRHPPAAGGEKRHHQDRKTEHAADDTRTAALTHVIMGGRSPLTDAQSQAMLWEDQAPSDSESP